MTDARHCAAQRASLVLAPAASRALACRGAVELAARRDAELRRRRRAPGHRAARLRLALSRAQATRLGVAAAAASADDSLCRGLPLVGRRHRRHDSFGAGLCRRLRRASIVWRGDGCRPCAAAVALIFFALNPNLLYLQTTAMTEPLFLCETDLDRRLARRVADALSIRDPERSGRFSGSIALILVAAVFHALRRMGSRLARLDLHRHHAAAPRPAALARPSGLPASWWSPRHSSGLSTTPLSSATGSTSRAAPTPPSHRIAHRNARLGSAASGLARSMGLAALLRAHRGNRRVRRAVGQSHARRSACSARSSAASSRGGALFSGPSFSGFRFPSTPIPSLTVRCPSSFPSGGRTPGTTRATAWSCCRPSR